MSGERLKFRKNSEHQLSQLSDNNLVAYLVAARDDSQDGEVRMATGMLVWRRHDVLVALVRAKVDNDQDVEDIVQQILEDTMKAAFRGVYAGEFFSLMKRIQERRVADFYAKKKRTPKQIGPYDDGSSPLDGVADDDDLIAGSIAEAALETALEGYSERDQLVIRLKMDGHPARAIAERVEQSGVEGGAEMSPANVDQIFSRFRKDFKAAYFPDDSVEPGQAA